MGRGCDHAVAGPQHKGFQTYAEAFQLARAGDPQARDLLIALARNPPFPPSRAARP